MTSNSSGTIRICRREKWNSHCNNYMLVHTQLWMPQTCDWFCPFFNHCRMKQPLSACNVCIYIFKWNSASSAADIIYLLYWQVTERCNQRPDIFDIYLIFLTAIIIQRKTFGFFFVFRYIQERINRGQPIHFIKGLQQLECNNIFKIMGPDL